MLDAACDEVPSGVGHEFNVFNFEWNRVEHLPHAQHLLGGPVKHHYHLIILFSQPNYQNVFVVMGYFDTSHDRHVLYCYLSQKHIRSHFPNEYLRLELCTSNKEQPRVF